MALLSDNDLCRISLKADGGGMTILLQLDRFFCNCNVDIPHALQSDFSTHYFKQNLNVFVYCLSIFETLFF